MVRSISSDSLKLIHAIPSLLPSDVSMIVDGVPSSNRTVATVTCFAFMVSIPSSVSTGCLAFGVCRSRFLSAANISAISVVSSGVPCQLLSS